METLNLNTIEEAIADIKAGKVIIVVDDEDRENEGDFLTAARNVTPEVINFMATHGRGLICAAVTEERAKELQLELMVTSNTALHETAFTVSVDLLGYGCTTGISTADRSKTVKALIDIDMKATDFGRPGHIFPLIAKRAKSIVASVCPVLRNTPPVLAIKGKICPGLPKSVAFMSMSINAFTVLDRSAVEIPVVQP